MTNYITGLTKNREEWIPAFIEKNNPENCISCGRCYKACMRGVFKLIDHPSSDYLGRHKVMAIVNDGNCIGCGACAAACPKDNITLSPIKT
ncbi:MAG: 4Fe-4S dicluster domain-containing protein [Methanosarcinales archaeon]